MGRLPDAWLDWLAFPDGRARATGAMETRAFWLPLARMHPSTVKVADSVIPIGRYDPPEEMRRMILARCLP